MPLLIEFSYKIASKIGDIGFAIECLQMKSKLLV